MSLSFHLLDRVGLALLAAWFTDPELSRRVSAPTEQWYQYVTANAGNFAWLAYEDRQPVGLIQLDTYSDQTGSISLIVYPELRSRGYGKRILRAFLLGEAAQGLNKIEAWIEPDNIASLRCFQGAGFTALSAEPDENGLILCVYTRPAPTLLI